MQLHVHVQIFCTCFCFTDPTGQTVGTADAKLAGHMYATTTFFVVTVLLRCRCLLATTRCFCACQDQTSLFERGPPVLGNFELATSNSARWCTLALSALRLLKQGAVVQCARAVHVQIFVTYCFFLSLQTKRRAPLMPNLQVTCMLPQPICFCGYRFCGV